MFVTFLAYIFIPAFGLAFLYRSQLKKKFKTKTIPIVISIILVLLGALILIAERYEWNNGYCIECGTKYVPNGHDRITAYWICPNCNYEISK